MSAPTADEVSRWSIDDVAAWAASRNFSVPTVQKLRDQEVSGNSLLTLKYDELTKPPFNIPGGPANEIVKFAEQLQPVGEKTLQSASDERDLKINEAGCIPLPVEASSVNLPSHLQMLKGYISKIYNLPVPTIRQPTEYHRKTDNLVAGLPSVIGNQHLLDLRLLPGHLGSEDAQSPLVSKMMEVIRADGKSDKRAAVRLHGPSGSGKTKAIFDVLSFVYGIYIDWSATQTRDVKSFMARVKEYRDSMPSAQHSEQEAFEKNCTHELYILYAGRFLVLVLLIAWNVVTCPMDWLYMQLNGLVLGNYHNLLGPVRNYLRTLSMRQIQELLPALTNPVNFSGYPTPGVIALDEINHLVSVLEQSFLSISTGMRERPLITLVLRATYNLAGPEVIVSGTSNVQDHFDYFLSLVSKPSQELPRTPLNLYTKCLKPAERVALAGRIVEKSMLTDELQAAVAKDATRPRFITTFGDCLDTRQFSGVPVVGTAIETWNKIRYFQIAGVRGEQANVDANNMTIFSSVQQFARKLGAETIASIVLQAIESKGKILLNQRDKLILESNLVFLAKDGKHYKLTEPIVCESIFHYIHSNGPSLYATLAQQVTSTQLSAQELGRKFEALVCLRFGDGEFNLKLPQGLAFKVPTKHHDIGTQDIGRWLLSRDSISRPIEAACVDILLPLDTSTNVSTLFGPVAPKPWICVAAGALKTTTRDNRTVDLRDIESGMFTSDIFNCYSAENDAYNLQKEAVLEALAKLQKQANLLFVRLQMNFPYPTRNYKNADLPEPGVIRRNCVTVTWGSTTIQYYELIVAVDASTASPLQIFSARDLEIYKSVWQTDGEHLKEKDMRYSKLKTVSKTVAPPPKGTKRSTSE